MFIIFDTETTGLPKNYKAPVTDTENWPRMVQLAWQLHNQSGKLIEAKNYIIKPEGYTIPYSAEKIHGISTEKAIEEGFNLKLVLEDFASSCENALIVAGHNIEFDTKIIGAEYERTGFPDPLITKTIICTKEISTDFCALPGIREGKFKWPNLTELHNKLFNENFNEAHNASADVAATARCFFELIRQRVIGNQDLQIDQNIIDDFIADNPDPIKPVEITIESHWDKNNLPLGDVEPIEEVDVTQAFVHLHVHTQYSILDGASSIKELFEKAKEYGMNAMAITDHGNMFGAKEFYDQARKYNIKPILGCEVYVARRSRFDKEEKTDGGGDHLVLLAKNKTGYKNLIKLVSYGWTEGFYYKPRIDKELLRKFSEGIIATSACLKGELAQALVHDGYDAGKRVVLEYKEIFGANYYLEMHRHQSGDEEKDKEVYEDQVFVNKEIVKLSQECHVKYIATNDVHFIAKEDAPAHDLLLCISTGKDVDDPNRLRYTTQEYFKSGKEMNMLFQDFPEALSNTVEIAESIEEYELNSDPIMPDFPIPEGFQSANDYLRHITFEGAHNRYKELTEEIKERINFELDIIKKMGFPGYFLIVWDVIKAAREMDVAVGPGRGSAAGSVVAYCLRITDIDPIVYDLLFERFLNPDRISMPDIDIDFDEDGREKVLKWVVQKYGADKVAHIITFGKMAPKMAIRDVARVQKLELSEADRLAKLVPERPGTSFEKAYEESPELLKEKNSENELVASTLAYAEVLEGSIRQVGVHACGIIIGKNSLEEHLPVCTNKDAELNVTQFDGKHVESIGMLKMDFLGLKTLSIIKDTVDNIRRSKGIRVDIHNIPLEDQETFELYSRGETTGLFQFESPGMKKHLRTLKPNRFEDLIAMNALYRPGPMDYIPNYIARKHGKEKVNYDMPEMEEYLKDTYGITVYQEQVMLLSQHLAGFSKGLADSLRKAMGKKIISMMNDLKEKFVDGCLKNGYSKNKIEKIWSDWEAFAQYAFNKSHSTCYAYISYQTAYLKAHYPAEFMAAVLSRNINDIKKITFFMDECKRMGLKVLVPDINESFARFTVNKEGHIRFGLAAIKGVGESAVEHIIQEREKNGPYIDIYNFVERVHLNTVNKKSLEALAMGGGFDSFNEFDRYQYFAEDTNKVNFIEQLVRYGHKFQEDKTSAPTLFGDISSIAVVKPVPVADTEWSEIYRLNKEKELIGVYLSSHPLDAYKLEIKSVCNATLSELSHLVELKGKDLCVAGIVTRTRQGMTKTGKPFGAITIDDYTDSYTFTFFGKDFNDFNGYFKEGFSLLLKGTVQPIPWKRDVEELEVKVKSIVLLSNLRDELFSKLYLKIALKDLKEDLLSEIKKYTQENKGKTQLSFTVYDNEENLKLNLFSRNSGVRLTNELLDKLENMPEIEYSVS